MGGEGTGADPDVYTLLYKNVFGAKWRLVTGYPGTTIPCSPWSAAKWIGLCGLSWSTLRSRHLHGSTTRVNIIIQAGLKKQPELPQACPWRSTSPPTPSRCRS